MKLLKFSLNIRHYSPKVSALIRTGHDQFKEKQAPKYFFQVGSEIFDKIPSGVKG